MIKKIFNKFVDWLGIDRETFRWWHLIVYPILYLVGAILFGVIYFLLILGVMMLAYM